MVGIKCNATLDKVWGCGDIASEQGHIIERSELYEQVILCSTKNYIIPSVSTGKYEAI